MTILSFSWKKIYIQYDIKNKIKKRKCNPNYNLNSIISTIYHDYNQKYTKFIKQRKLYFIIINWILYFEIKINLNFDKSSKIIIIIL